ncbi:MAG: flagellar brake protein [Desulfobacterales bacterium]|nr:flagellar brake protein [Desulfobacterales bacterium]
MSEENKLKISNQGMRLNVELSSPLSIQIEGMEGHFKSILVGLVPQEYLIIRMPSFFLDQIQLHEGKHLTVQYQSLGKIYGFSSNIIALVVKPYPLIFLSYPETVDSLLRRKNPRVSCYIPAIANLDKTELKGVISDISRNGCKFTIKVPSILQLQQILVVNDVKLSFPLYGMQGMQNFQGKVRNTTQERERIAWGIEFEKLDTEISNSIEAYIDRMAEYTEHELSDL